MYRGIKDGCRWTAMIIKLLKYLKLHLNVDNRTLMRKMYFSLEKEGKEKKLHPWKINVMKVKTSGTQPK